MSEVHEEILAVFLSVLMMLSMFATVIGATEIETVGNRLSETEVAAIVEEAFPEHNMAVAESKNTVSAWENAENKILVQNETRKISDDIEVTYLRYSNDTSAYIVSTCNFYTNSTSSGNGYTTTNTDIILTIPGYIGTMYVSSLDYTIYTNSYDLVYGKDQRFHYSPQASIWRWREHFQNDFLMRLTWSTTNDYSVCDHLQEYDDSEVIIEANSDEEKEISLSIIEDASYEYAYKFYQYHLSDKESEILIKSDKNKALIKSSKKGIYHIICEFSRKKNFKITRYKRFIIIVK